MSAPLKIVMARSANRYFEHLDAPTRERMRIRLLDIAADPENFRFSEPLKNSSLRSAHVGGWRILLAIEGDTLQVSEIQSRGQIYRKLGRKG